MLRIFWGSAYFALSPFLSRPSFAPRPANFLIYKCVGFRVWNFGSGIYPFLAHWFLRKPRASLSRLPASASSTLRRRRGSDLRLLLEGFRRLGAASWRHAGPLGGRQPRRTQCMDARKLPSLSPWRLCGRRLACIGARSRPGCARMGRNGHHAWTTHCAPRRPASHTAGIRRWRADRWCGLLA